MAYVYKIPTDLISVDHIRSMRGSAGTWPNPIQDNSENWVLTETEWDSPEWEWVKEVYPTIASEFVRIEYVKKPTPLYV